VTGQFDQPRYDTLPPDAPATVEDVRSARRWTWVALAWAVAASAVAIIALIVSNNNNNTSQDTTTQTSPDVAAQLKKFQDDTNARLDAFSRRLNDTAAKSDVDKLDKRLSAVESDVSKTKGDVSKQSADIKQLQTDVKDLQQRVNTLESQSQNQSTGTTTTP
jgi:peptidoglycan hydrolase CwlO-like protein